MRAMWSECVSIWGFQYMCAVLFLKLGNIHGDRWIILYPSLWILIISSQSIILHLFLGRAYFGACQVALAVKNLPANVGDIRDIVLIPGFRRSPGGGRGNPLQYSCLKNPMDRGSWRATVHGAAQSQTQLKWLSRAYLTVTPIFKKPTLCESYGIGEFLKWKISWGFESPLEHIIPPYSSWQCHGV